MLDGETTATINGKKTICKKDTLIAVPGYTVHGYHASGLIETIVLIVPKNYISHFDEFFKYNALKEFIYIPEDPSAIKSYFEFLDNADLSSDSRINKCYVDLIFSTFIEKIAVFSPVGNQKTYKLVQDILEYIDEHFSEDLSITSVAEQFSYSVSSFSRIFNKHIGYTFPTYVGMIRAKNAARLILNENYSIIDAAFESGFDNLRTFYRVFKKCFLMTPNEYKNKP